MSIRKWYDLSTRERIKIIKNWKSEDCSWAKLAVKVGLKPTNKSTIYQFADRQPELNFLFPKKIPKVTPHQPSVSIGGIPPPPPKRGVLPPPPPPKISGKRMSQKVKAEVTEIDWTLKYIEWRTAKNKRRYNSLLNGKTDVKRESIKSQSEAPQDLETVYPQTYDMNELHERLQQKRLQLEQSLDDTNRLAGEKFGTS